MRMGQQADDRHGRGPDRRRRPTRPWDVLFTPGRRRWNRRAEDRDRYEIVDRHGPRMFLLIMALLVLTLVDGGLTLLLIDSHRDEANPLMARLLQRGAMWFIVGKYALTAAAVPWLVLWKDHRLFRSPVRVKHLLPVFVGLYLALTGCQAWALADPQGPSRLALAFLTARTHLIETLRP
jgi:hypothetical protein